MNDNNNNYNDDYEEKPKRKRKGDNVEWSFDFNQLGENIKGFFDALAGDEEVQQSTFTLERDGTTESLRVEVDFTVGRGRLSALPADAELFRADVTHVGEMVFTHNGTDKKRVRLEQRKPASIAAPFKQGIRAITERADLSCDVSIAPDVPVTLEIDGGIGPVTIDMMGLRVHRADIDSGVGTMDVHLPAQADAIILNIESGVGETKIVAPAGAHGEIDVEAGVGQVTITVAPNTAVRVRAESGIGSINVPKNFVRVKGKRDDFLGSKGVWQTEGYELAERKLNISYEGGIGAFNVRVADVV